MARHASGYSTAKGKGNPYLACAPLDVVLDVLCLRVISPQRKHHHIIFARHYRRKENITAKKNGAWNDFMAPVQVSGG
jgi:hypothetical protein